MAVVDDSEYIFKELVSANFCEWIFIVCGHLNLMV